VQPQEPAVRDTTAIPLTSLLCLIHRAWRRRLVPRSMYQRQHSYPCPNCGHQSATRSQTRGLERLLKPFTSLRPYRCSFCEWRWWCRAESSGHLQPFAWRLAHPRHKGW